MKKIVKQGESILIKGNWYNQGEEYESDESGRATEIIPIETLKPKNKQEKKEEG